jgi:hypothetical protein
VDVKTNFCWQLEEVVAFVGLLDIVRDGSGYVVGLETLGDVVCD